MSKKIYVASTLATSVQYTGYAPASEKDANLPRQQYAITIAGGAGVANKKLVTPRGVITAIDEDQLKLLTSNPVFVRHAQRGFINPVEGDVDGDEVAADMTGRDNSAPLVQEDFADKSLAPAAVGGNSTGNGGKRSK